MKKKLKFLIIILFALSSCKREAPDFLIDNANMFLLEDRAELNSRLYEYNRTTGKQFLVYTITSTDANTTIEEYSNELIKRIDFGRKGFGNSIVMFIYLKEHSVRLRWGNRFKDLISDNIARDIIANVGEYFSKNEFKSGVFWAIEKIERL